MQRIRTFDGKRLIIFVIIPVFLAAVLIAIDQITKYYAAINNVDITVIKNFFYLKYATNSGAGFSFLADKEWGQLLFKIITPLALIGFIGFYVFAAKKSYKWLAFSLVAVIAGTIGNYIDRLLNSEVVDFFSFHFGSYIFPTFNVADICLTVGVTMLIIHFLFIDENAVFINKKKDGEIQDNSDNEKDL